MRYTQTRSIDLVLDSPDKVGEYGLTLVGDAYVDKLGLHCDRATSSYATMPLTDEFNSDELTIFIKCKPDWDEETDSNFRFFFSSDTGDYLAYINSGNRVLSIQLGGTTVMSSNKSVWGPYWNNQGENEIAISSKSGRTRLVINGVQVPSSASLWTKSVIKTLYLGGHHAAGDYEFGGKINNVQIFKNNWSVEDIEAYFNGTLLNFRNQALTWLDFRSEKLDGSTRYLPDETGNGNDFSMVGDPEFINPVGYKLDTNDGFTNTSPSEKYTDLEEYSVCIQTAPDFPLDELVNNHLWGEDNTTSSIYRSSSAARLRFHFIAVVIGFYTPAELAGIWNDKSTNIIVASYKSGKNNIWINGHHVLVNGTATFVTPFTMTSLALCAQVGGAYSWDGKTYHMSDYDFALSPLQALQLTSDLLTSKN